MYVFLHKLILKHIFANKNILNLQNLQQPYKFAYINISETNDKIKMILSFCNS